MREASCIANTLFCREEHALTNRPVPQFHGFHLSVPQCAAYYRPRFAPRISSHHPGIIDDKPV
ncbi:MAG: hypothetical protein SV422_03040, partial [Pseudomonadota bacterium]|nr:hypothetical protein [Pseudomonadota bacterium]